MTNLGRSLSSHVWTVSDHVLAHQVARYRDHEISARFAFPLSRPRRHRPGTPWVAGQGREKCCDRTPSFGVGIRRPLMQDLINLRLPPRSAPNPLHTS